MTEHKYSPNRDPATIFHLCEGTRHLAYRILNLVRTTLDYVGYMVPMTYRILKSIPVEHLPGGKWNTLIDPLVARYASLDRIDLHENDEIAIWALDNALSNIRLEYDHICCYGTFLSGTNNYKIACDYYARRHEHPEIHPINFIVLEADKILMEALELHEQIAPYVDYIIKELPKIYTIEMIEPKTMNSKRIEYIVPNKRIVTSIYAKYVMDGYQSMIQMFRNFDYYFTPYRDIVLEKYKRR